MRNNKNNPKNYILRFFRSIYNKLVLINDTPQKIALGFGLGVFSGILPGTGPIAALFLAVVFRANRASALLGSLLTNTWLSFVMFLAAIKTGAVIFGIQWIDLKQEWLNLIRDFHWATLFKSSVLGIIIPVFLGYIFIGLCSGVISYLVSLTIVLTLRKTKRVEN